MELSAVQKANCGYLQCICRGVRSTNKKLKALAAAIAAEGPGMDTPHAPTFLSAPTYPYIGDDSYQRLVRDAIAKIDIIMTEKLDWCDELVCELPQPDFIAVTRSRHSRAEKKSLFISLGLKEQKLYEQASRVANGNKRLLPLCYEVCHLQQQAFELIQIIDRQGAALAALFPRLTAKGVLRLLWRIQHDIPEHLFNELSYETFEQVDWLLRDHGRGYFTGVSASSTSCFIHTEEEQTAMLQRGNTAGDSNHMAATSTPHAAAAPPADSSVGDASCSVTPSSKRKGTGKAGLGKGMKWLCVGLASNIGKLAKGAGKATAMVLGIGKLPTAAAAA